MNVSMRFKVLLLLSSAWLLLGCNPSNWRLVEVVPLNATPTPLPTAPPPATPVPAGETVGAAGGEVTQGGSGPTIATPVPTPRPTIRERVFGLINQEYRGESEESLPLHGVGWVLLLPALLIGVPWIFLEIIIVRYVQPRGIDLSEILVKSQDGLFIGATVSMTARRTLSLASTRMTWPRVREFVEKGVEQELIHRASEYPSLDQLERGITDITRHLMDLPVVKELYDDFGVELLRFNLEIRYTPETMTALNNKAEAAAGGNAYLAYAYAAHLDPEAPEARELYRVYQQTTSTVEAARNLGTGISGLTNFLNPANRMPKVEADEGDE